MALSIVQSAHGEAHSAGHTSVNATFLSTPTEGHLLLIVVSVDEPASIPVPVSTPSGWTAITSTNQHIFTKTAGASESTSVTVNHDASLLSAMVVFEFSDGAVLDTHAQSDFVTTTTYSTPSVTPTAGAATMLLILATAQNAYGVASPPSGYTAIDDSVADTGSTSMRVSSWRKNVTASGSYSSSHTYASLVSGHSMHLALIEDPALVADFDASPTSGIGAPLTVSFTDLSHGGSGSYTWLWDFGDGNTSTSQNPSHVYASVGTYTVSLTTNDGLTTDTITQVALINVGAVYVPPPPSNAVIEIRAAAIGAARWGVAHWGEDVWSSAAWIDVTPQSVDATVRWGSHSPSDGILTETEPASWVVDTYDPDRLLDPGNADSPYHADLRAGLPIRIRHRGTIVRQGICETIAYYHAAKQGGIRATDHVSTMARTPVPDDTVLSDTLRARARDVIAAAGLSITVEPDPPSGDPALAPRLDGERSVWRHVQDAAQQVLHVPFLDNVGTLHFRAWASPYDRNRGVDATNLVDLGAIVETAGLYSVVRALQTVGDGGMVIERRLTPTPRYGPVTYERTEATPDADDWAAAVLADRSLQSVQWIPGAIYPITADDVEYFATLESMERFGVDDAYAVPAVDIVGIIVGGEFTVHSKKLSQAVWSFQVEVAQTADSPLYTDTDPAEFLLNETGDGYLYPD